MDAYKSILESNGFCLNDSVYRNLQLFNQSSDARKHVALLLDKHHNVLSYRSNVYYKSARFPYSRHAEVSAVVNYYSKRVNKPTPKILIVLRLKSEGFGLSRPCKHCARFVLNNWSRLCLTQVLYSDPNGRLIRMRKSDLQSGDFVLSTGAGVHSCT